MQTIANKVVILVITHKSELSLYEKISLQQCFNTFSEREIYIICPEGLNISEYKAISPDLNIDFIHFRWQSNYQNFNRLKILPFLYERYKKYEYILFYEPDAFVFRDELDQWCDKGFDYAGAPWFDGFNSKEGSGDFLGVGNGGFSLRNTAAHLRVLHSLSYVTSFKENWNSRFVEKRYGKNMLKQAAGLLLDHTIRNNTYWRFNSYNGHEDQFWGLDVPKVFSWFKKPLYEEAASFAFEMQPRRLYELNNHQLPFGCHAWWKYDLDFWKPHIEKFGYKL